MRRHNIFVAALFCCVFTGSNSVYWPCESNGDCTADGSSCTLNTGLCECHDFDSVFSGNYTKCLKTSLFGDICEDTVQCNLMPSGANCKNGVCDCADGHTYVRGRCRPLNGLDQNCDTSFDCYFGYDRQSVTCQNKVCACANGYYRRHGNICRRKSMEIDDACVVDTDCNDLGANVECKNLMCQYVNESTTAAPKRRVKPIRAASTSSEITQQSYDLKSPLSEATNDTETGSLVNGNNNLTDTETETENETDTERKLKSREIAVQTSIDAFELKPLVPIRKNVATATTSTSTSTSRRTSNFVRRQSTFRYDDEDKTLSTLSNTDDDVDARKYGSSCSENGKSCSGLPHSICSNSICLCKQGYYNKNGKCFAELGEIAESADECEHEFENISKKCICQKNYFYDHNLRGCRKPIQFHLACTANSQCSPFGPAFCAADIPRRCKCAEFSDYEISQQMCVFKQGLGSQCQNNDGCPVKHSICLDNYCVCKQYFNEKGGICVPGIGAICEADDECPVENAACVPTDSSSEEKTKTCSCRKGFVHFKDECLKEAEELEDECVENEQCKPLLGTCIDKKCSCTPEQHFQYGRCEEKKNIGDACSRAGECFIKKEPENVECRNSVCQCKPGFQANTQHQTCIRVVANKKNSSGRPSALKIITFALIGSAFLITTAAIKQAYY